MLKCRTRYATINQIGKNVISDVFLGGRSWVKEVISTRF